LFIPRKLRYLETVGIVVGRPRNAHRSIPRKFQVVETWVARIAATRY
jgi:hypothetical protein